jgi:hypothetical protein
MTDPQKIMVAGDWHGNARWAVDVIWRARKLLADEPARTIVQLGDFGFWPYKWKNWADGDRKPDGLQYLMDVQSALELADAHLLVTPGNHDDYDALERWTEPDYPEYASYMPDTPYGRLSRIHVLPRGHRWTWHGRTWLSVGGAVSVDRISGRRVQGESWWPQEEITDEQEAAVIARGHADVMVCHDYPTAVALTFHGTDHHQASDFGFHKIDLDRSKAHQARMQRIVNAVQPEHYLHGHLHIKHSRRYRMPYGDCQVTGLGMDGENGNFAVLNVKTMEWE